MANSAEENSSAISTEQRLQPVHVLLCDGCEGDGDQRKPAYLAGVRGAISRRYQGQDHSEASKCDRLSPSAEIYAFLGVPFAEIPERFARPRALGRLWTGIRQASNFGAVCPQDLRLTNRFYSPFQLKSNVMNENCLFLNVWTPTLNNAAKLPVMVWIYGGYYKIGSSEYFDGTAYAAMHNVIFVSFNYRTGVFGFLYTGSGDNDVHGNMGLLDQREALRWVRKYIHRFGGDPDNVTLFGNSAGASSVCWHLVSPGSSGLFRRAIVQSGSMFRYRSVLTPAGAHRRLKCFLARKGVTNIDNVSEIVCYLKTLPANLLIDDGGPEFLFMPVIDGVEITSHPLKLIHGPDGCRLTDSVDLMVGSCTDEGYVNAKAAVRNWQQRIGVEELCVDNSGGTSTELTRKMAQDIISNDLHREFVGHPKLKGVVQSIWNEYFWTLDDSSSENDIMKCLSDVYGDMVYILPSIYTARIHAADGVKGHTGQQRTYLYQFDHRPSSSRLPDWVIATHGQEIPFVIGIPLLERARSRDWSCEDLQTTELMMTAWSNFAKTGNPNKTALSTNTDFRWPPYDVTNRCHAVIRSSPSVGHAFRQQRAQFWQDVTEQLVLGTGTLLGQGEINQVSSKL